MDRLVVESHKLRLYADGVWQAHMKPPPGEEELVASEGGVVVLDDEAKLIHVSGGRVNGLGGAVLEV